MTIRYDATVEGTAEAAPVEELDLIAYRRPSRYCESDQLLPTAHAEFQGLEGKPLLDAVSSWVGAQLSYIPGSSKPTDGATETLLARQGVCRDYAHLVVALLRALDVPARLVAVYAPGLDPMDFHAVAEAYIEDAWHVVDATALAPRSTLLRIATGRDAADTAFLTTIGGLVNLTMLHVTATVDDLPARRHDPPRPPGLSTTAGTPSSSAGSRRIGRKTGRLFLPKRVRPARVLAPAGSAGDGVRRRAARDRRLRRLRRLRAVARAP